MKAAIYNRYGPPDVVEIKDAAKAVPDDDKVLIRIHAASVNPYDWHFMRGLPYLVRIISGLRRPKIPRLGADVAGVVEAVGSKVARLKVGDEVFGMCRGAFAEYVCAPEATLAIKPNGVTFEQAACVPIAACTALQALRDKCGIQAGQKVLVNGASGGVGSFGVQIAKTFGAHVTGVCRTRNLEMVRSMGADRVIDYTVENFTKSDQRYDLILDCVGNHSLSALRRVLGAKGILVSAGGESGRWKVGLARGIRARMWSLLGGRRLVGILAKAKPEDLAFLANLIQTGKVIPVIDRSYGLNQTREAIRYLEEGHARGKVVIAVEETRRKARRGDLAARWVGIVKSRHEQRSR